MIVVAIVDFGWLQYQKMILQQINREGVSAAIAGLDPEIAMLSVITIKRLSGTPTVDISCLNESGSIVSPCVIDGAMKAEVATITFAVTLDHTPFFTYSEAFGIGGNISDTLKIQIQ
jgi:Flp pilus assembly protein TadG